MHYNGEQSDNVIIRASTNIPRLHHWINLENPSHTNLPPISNNNDVFVERHRVPKKAGNLKVFI